MNSPPRLSTVTTSTPKVTQLIREAIGHHMDSSARSQQTALGPSEIGDACQRRIAYKLAQVPSNTTHDPMAMFIGTAVHRELADALEEQEKHHPGSWLIEHRVNIAEDISGTVDAVHLPTGTVIDHKIVHPEAVKRAQSEGPSTQYRAQVHLYGLGVTRAGYHVESVAIVFYVKTGTLNTIYQWEEPWDASYASEVLKNYHTVQQRVSELPVSEFDQIPTTSSIRDCTFCPYFAPDAPLSTPHCCGPDAPHDYY